MREMTIEQSMLTKMEPVFGQQFHVEPMKKKSKDNPIENDRVSTLYPRTAIRRREAIVIPAGTLIKVENEKGIIETLYKPTGPSNIMPSPIQFTYTKYQSSLKRVMPCFS